MKVELHAHTIRHSPCAILTASDLLMSLIEHEYDAVYITEHDALWPEEDLDYLRKKFPWMRIFGGLERTVDGCHVLVLGTSDTKYLQMTDAQSVIAAARADGHLTVLAHPFRWEGAEKLLAAGVLPDALEWRTPNHTEENRAQFAQGLSRDGR